MFCRKVSSFYNVTKKYVVKIIEALGALIVEYPTTKRW
jgi:hypothetical protein